MSATVKREPASERRSLPEIIRTTFAVEGEDRRNLLELAVIFVAVIASVYLVGWVAWKTWGLPEGAPVSLIQSVFDRWDVLNYELIAQYGYKVSEQHPVWFPALPAIMRVGHWFGLPYWLAGTIAVLVCAAVLTWAFYHLVRLDYGPEVARQATLFLLIFPASFFLYVPYTEAIFMMFAVGSFYCARKRYWAGAAILAGCASGVRSTGMFLLPALAVEYLSSVGWNWRQVRPDAAWLVLAPAGLVVYMIYSAIRLDDALAFVHAQDKVVHLETIKAQSGFPDFIESVLNRPRLLWVSQSQTEVYMNAIALAGIAFFLLTFAGMLYYRIRASYIVFTLPAVFAALPVGRIDSMNRYILYGFPMFIVMALVAQRWPYLRTPWVCVSLAVLYLSAVRFATNEWAG